jgi:hypothetical protein
MRTAVRHRFVRSQRGRSIRPLAWAMAAALIALSFAGPAAVGAASPPSPTYGAATVDGATGDWALGADVFADMTDAGNPAKPVVGHLYLRYDCTSGTLYALVLGAGGTQFQQTRPENAYIRLDGAGKSVSGLSGNDGTPPDFSWVGGDGTLADGFEASVSVPVGSHTVRAHVLRPDNSPDGYQSVDPIGRDVPLELACETATATPAPTATTSPTRAPTTTPTPGGTVKAETATPKVTLPPTATLDSDGQPPVASLSLVFLGLGLVMAGALVLLDKPKLATGRRRR